MTEDLSNYERVAGGFWRVTDPETGRTYKCVCATDTWVCTCTTFNRTHSCGHIERVVAMETGEMPVSAPKKPETGIWFQAIVLPHTYCLFRYLTEQLVVLYLYPDRFTVLAMDQFLERAKPWKPTGILLQSIHGQKTENKWLAENGGLGL